MQDFSCRIQSLVENEMNSPMEVIPLQTVMGIIRFSSNEKEFETVCDCSCYQSCGSNFSRNGKCSCYTSCGSNYS